MYQGPYTFLKKSKNKIMGIISTTIRMDSEGTSGHGCFEEKGRAKHLMGYYDGLLERAQGNARLPCLLVLSKLLCC